MPNKAHRTRTRSKPKIIHKSEHHHYLPYLPMLLMTIGIFFIAFIQPTLDIGVLSYATEMSQSQLIASTNQRRAANGVAALKLNSQLNNSAQAKANDMVTKNYWSHNSPNGDEPWVFFEAAGYKYLKAGENLAYGFSSSDSTVTGWMNSPTHRDNMLDYRFTEVGFGYKNGADYNNSGQETVVVAHYGKPQVLAESSAKKPPSDQTAAAEPAEAPAPMPVAETKNEEPKKETKKEAPVTTDEEIVVDPKTQPVSRAEVLSKNDIKWQLFAIGIITGGLTVFLLVKHTVRIRHLIRDGEKFVLHHPLLDTIVVGLILVGTYLLQTSGFVR